MRKCEKVKPRKRYRVALKQLKAATKADRPIGHYVTKATKATKVSSVLRPNLRWRKVWSAPEAR